MSTATEEPANTVDDATINAALTQLLATYRHVTGPAQHVVHDLEGIQTLLRDLGAGVHPDIALDRFRHDRRLCPWGNGHRNLNCQWTCVPPSSTLL